MKTIATRIAALNWLDLGASLTGQGFAMTPTILTAGECQGLIETFAQENLFRKKVVMAKHDYGQGIYGYYRYPLPALIDQLRQSFFERLAPIANDWCEKLSLPADYPPKLNSYLQTCHQAGQSRPTPLLLRYGAGDFNRLHRDLYGEIHFPMQVAILLDQPGVDFEGGEFILVEQKPRSQSKAEVVPLRQGQAVIFAVNECPRMGSRGYRRLKLSHGVSRIRAGHRHTLGIIFHDAG